MRASAETFKAKRYCGQPGRIVLTLEDKDGVRCPACARKIKKSNHDCRRLPRPPLCIDYRAIVEAVVNRARCTGAWSLAAHANHFHGCPLEFGVRGPIGAQCRTKSKHNCARVEHYFDPSVLPSVDFLRARHDLVMFF